MNKNLLAKEVAVSEKITLTTAFKAVDGVLRVITETLAKGDTIQLRGFGSFALVDRPERTLRNFQTDEPIVVPAHKSVRFKVSKDVINKLNKKGGKQ